MFFIRFVILVDKNIQEDVSSFQVKVVLANPLSNIGLFLKNFVVRMPCPMALLCLGNNPRSISKFLGAPEPLCGPYPGHEYVAHGQYASS